MTTLNEQLEVMCRRCINFEVCEGSGCQPRADLRKLIDDTEADRCNIDAVLSKIEEQRKKWGKDAELNNTPLTELRHEHLSGIWRGLTMAENIVRRGGTR